MGNRLHLPTIHETFAHLPKWDGTTQHAVTLLADLLCYRVVSGPEARPLWLITQTNQTQEAQECLERNAENPLIDKIILLQETGMLPTRKSVAISKKVEERSIGRRLTYAEIMRTILTFPPDVLVVFANPTIFLDLGWKDLWTLNLENVCLALRRYELPASGNMDNPELVSSASPSASPSASLADSQDCFRLGLAQFPTVPRSMNVRFLHLPQVIRVVFHGLHRKRRIHGQVAFCAHNSPQKKLKSGCNMIGGWLLGK
jgi:hypothetical protein